MALSLPKATSTCKASVHFNVTEKDLDIKIAKMILTLSLGRATNFFFLITTKAALRLI
jgi:hypothetical protein